MKKLFAIAIVPSLVGAALALLQPVAIADCGCISVISTLSPQEVPGDICAEDDGECSGFLDEGWLYDDGDNAISIRIHSTDVNLHLEGPQ